MMLRGGGTGAALAHAGRFAQDNGGCCYVLKPRHLRIGAQADDEDGEHMEPAENSDLTTLTLKLRVLAARAAVPLVRGGQVSLAVSVWGASGDCKREIYRPVSTTC